MYLALAQKNDSAWPLVDYKQNLYEAEERIYATAINEVGHYIFVPTWRDVSFILFLLPVESRWRLTLKPPRIPLQPPHGATCLRTWRAGCPGSGRC